LTYLLPFYELIEAFFDKLGLKYIIEVKPIEFVTYVINTLYVPHTDSVSDMI